MIVIGVDPHKSTHTATALDPATNSDVGSVRIAEVSCCTKTGVIQVRRHVTGQAGFSPDRLANCTRHAVAEIRQRPNPARRLRTCPRVTKRANRSKFPRKHLGHNNIRHRAPPEIGLINLQS